MKHFSIFLVMLALVMPAQAAFAKDSKPASSSTAGSTKTAPEEKVHVPPALYQECPLKGAEAIKGVDDAIRDRRPRLAILCYAEVVKDLQARVKALEARQ